MDETIEKALNDQIKHEAYSAYLYLSMAAYFDSINLPGFAHWMKVQRDEEQSHALKIYDYVYDRGGRVTLQALEQPPSEFGSALEAFQQALEHERKVTGLINGLHELAQKHSDYATQAFLQWFINEQVEEEKTASDIVERLKLAGERGSALLWIDKELGSR